MADNGTWLKGIHFNTNFTGFTNRSASTLRSGLRQLVISLLLTRYAASLLIIVICLLYSFLNMLKIAPNYALLAYILPIPLQAWYMLFWIYIIVWMVVAVMWAQATRRASPDSEIQKVLRFTMRQTDHPGIAMIILDILVILTAFVMASVGYAKLQLNRELPIFFGIVAALPVILDFIPDHPRIRHVVPLDGLKITDILRRMKQSSLRLDELLQYNDLLDKPATITNKRISDDPQAELLPAVLVELPANFVLNSTPRVQHTTPEDVKPLS